MTHTRLTGPTEGDQGGMMGRATQRYIAGVLATLVLAAPAPAGAKEPLPSQGHCREVALAVPTKSARVRPYVPARFELDDHGTGVTYVAAFGERCRLAAGPDEPQEDSYLFGTITPVREPGGDGSFDFSWTTTDTAYHSRLRTMGFGELVPSATYEEKEVAGGVIEATAAVPGGAMPFTFRATTGPTPSAPALPVDSIHWSEGLGQRFVRCLYGHEFTRFTGVRGTVTPGPRSPLEAMLGPGSHEAAGLFAEFDFTGDCRFA